jgi:hypothetical protein
VKRTREDEPIGVVIHVCMEISHGNSLYSYPYLKLAKTSCFLSFIFFSSTKSENRRAEQVLQGGGAGTSWRGEVAEKGGRRMNMVQIMCTHVCKCILIFGVLILTLSS